MSEVFKEKYMFLCELSDEQVVKVQSFFENLGVSVSSSIVSRNRVLDKQPVFRFELFFCGEWQSCGLFHGLADACGPATYHKFMSAFSASELPIPTGMDHLRCSFWFTEKGLQKFTPAINAIHNYFVRKDNGWELRGAYLHIHDSDCLYEDDYQVALEADIVNERAYHELVDGVDGLKRLYEKEMG